MTENKNLKEQGWDWIVRCTYNEKAKPPRVPGTLAIETVHKGDSSRDMEVMAAETRDDINIEVIKL